MPKHHPKFTERFATLPKSIQNLVRFSVESLKPSKIILFGSRARGDFREDSDFDIAFELVDTKDNLWSKFSVQAQEDPYTLYSTDLVRMDQLDESYHRNILKEGILLYG
jgi:predicted nucleotidyltransferase